MVADSTGLLPYKSFVIVSPVPSGILASLVFTAFGAGLLSTPGKLKID